MHVYKHKLYSIRKPSVFRCSFTGKLKKMSCYKILKLFLCVCFWCSFPSLFYFPFLFFYGIESYFVALVASNVYIITE